MGAKARWHRCRQAQVERDIGARAPVALLHAGHEERDVQHVDLVGEDVVLEPILEDHDVIDGDGAGDENGHIAGL